MLAGKKEEPTECGDGCTESKYSREKRDLALVSFMKSVKNKSKENDESRKMPIRPSPSDDQEKAETKELLEKHLSTYHELLKIQPKNHTEKQLALGRSSFDREEEDAKAEELERLRRQKRAEFIEMQRMKELEKQKCENILKVENGFNVNVNNSCESDVNGSKEFDAAFPDDLLSFDFEPGKVDASGAVCDRSTGARSKTLSSLSSLSLPDPPAPSDCSNFVSEEKTSNDTIQDIPALSDCAVDKSADLLTESYYDDTYDDMPDLIDDNECEDWKESLFKPIPALISASSVCEHAGSGLACSCNPGDTPFSSGRFSSNPAEDEDLDLQKALMESLREDAIRKLSLPEESTEPNVKEKIKAKIKAKQCEARPFVLPTDLPVLKTAEKAREREEAERAGKDQATKDYLKLIGERDSEDESTISACSSDSQESHIESLCAESEDFVSCEEYLNSAAGDNQSYKSAPLPPNYTKANLMRDLEDDIDNLIRDADTPVPDDDSSFDDDCSTQVYSEEYFSNPSLSSNNSNAFAPFATNRILGVEAALLRIKASQLLPCLDLAVASKAPCPSRKETSVLGHYWMDLIIGSSKERLLQLPSNPEIIPDKNKDDDSTKKVVSAEENTSHQPPVEEGGKWDCVYDSIWDVETPKKNKPPTPKVSCKEEELQETEDGQPQESVSIEKIRPNILTKLLLQDMEEKDQEAEEGSQSGYTSVSDKSDSSVADQNNNKTRRPLNYHPKSAKDTPQENQPIVKDSKRIERATSLELPAGRTKYGPYARRSRIHSDQEAPFDEPFNYLRRDISDKCDNKPHIPVTKQRSGTPSNPRDMNNESSIHGYGEPNLCPPVAVHSIDGRGKIHRNGNITRKTMCLLGDNCKLRSCDEAHPRDLGRDRGSRPQIRDLDDVRDLGRDQGSRPQIRDLDDVRDLGRNQGSRPLNRDIRRDQGSRPQIRDLDDPRELGRNHGSRPQIRDHDDPRELGRNHGSRPQIRDHALPRDLGRDQESRPQIRDLGREQGSRPQIRDHSHPRDLEKEQGTRRHISYHVPHRYRREEESTRPPSSSIVMASSVHSSLSDERVEANARPNKCEKKSTSSDSSSSTSRARYGPRARATRNPNLHDKQSECSSFQEVRYKSAPGSGDGCNDSVPAGRGRGRPMFTDSAKDQAALRFKAAMNIRGAKDDSSYGEPHKKPSLKEPGSVPGRGERAKSFGSNTFVQDRRAARNNRRPFSGANRQPQDSQVIRSREWTSRKEKTGVN